MFIKVLLGLPAFFQDNGDHGLHQQGIGAGAYRQVDIGNCGRLAMARIDGHQEPVRIFGNFHEHFGRPGHLVTLHAVPPPGDQHLCFVFVGTGDIVLFAEYTAGHPPGAAELLAG